MSPTVLVERQGNLAHLVLNRPEVLNAIDNTLAEELGAACEALAADDSVWAIILRGAGERAFSAGADLKARRDFSPEQWSAQRTLFRGAPDLANRLGSQTKPASDSRHPKMKRQKS